MKSVLEFLKLCPSSTFKKWLLLSLFVSCAAYAYQYEISVAVITKEEHHYLKEWIDYHHRVGVDHFYFYDNNLSDETEKVLLPYVESGLVEYIRWPNLWPKEVFAQGCQIYAYRDALSRATGQTKWLALIDTDEFILPTKYSDLKETLAKEYENKPLIFINWRMFGTSYVSLPPPCLLLPHLIKCAKKENTMNRWGKILFQPEALVRVTNPHINDGVSAYYDGSGNLYPFTTVKEVSRNPNYPVHEDLLRVNHYIFRDEWFFKNVKIPRLLKRFKGSSDSISQAFIMNDEYCVDECTKILKFK